MTVTARVDELIKVDRKVKLKEISLKLVIPKTNVYEIVHDKLGYRKVCARWVPKMLSDEHKRLRVEISQILLHRCEQEGDETVDVGSVAPIDTSVNTLSRNSTILLATVPAACLLAFVTVLTVLIIRSRKARFPREIDQQAASETSERRQSDRNDDLLEERISDVYEEIVEGRILSDDYESILDEDVSGNIVVYRKASSSIHYQKINIEYRRTWPRGASALSKKDKSSLKLSKSCGDLPNGKTDTLEHVYDRTATTEQEPEPFYSTFIRANSEMEEQPRPRWFMLRDSTGVFYSTNAEKSIELKDFSIRERCSANADGEGEYLTALDSSCEHEDYLELIAD
ncbi:histone-lysine N-methyltransferase SETMAR [Plakobranchus ocellatus]|uniref:Histone-lysine N-methyltransferase SETMAR n=1 Tax=Plakobranchus ocellatus TaxID=259542 RepID=A0AAV3ZMZ9_9GAST|nr:histone-lysine N-methyltransferase SETMAR [Plakobranchus ocellatus]